jgi:hypothetical protein
MHAYVHVFSILHYLLYFVAKVFANLFFLSHIFVDSSKSSEDVVKEGQIISEMLEIVEQRDSLIALLEEDRQRCGHLLKHGCFRRSLSGPTVLRHFQTALPQRVSSKEGFSLISVLVVLVVMWALSYVVVGSYFSLSLAGDTL